MNSRQLESFVRAQQIAQQWLCAIADQLEVPDQNYAYRLLRAWLHTLRDRLPVGQAVQFAAHLPELLRGVYYEGWEPADTPLKLDVDNYIGRFAREAKVSTAEVRHGAVAVTVALRGLMWPGQMEGTFAHLPRPIRQLLEPPGAVASHARVMHLLPAPA
jgi:uncharacterized protein (DUF2267 family)